MKKADFIKNHEDFDTWILWHGEMLNRIVKARKIVRTRMEKLELLEALIVRCSAHWEILVEKDIITSLNRDCSYYAAALNLDLKKHPTVDECTAMLIGHRYLDFKSVDDVKKFAKDYLSPHYNPFSAIPNDLGKRVDELMTMRNVLTHYSDYSWRSYYRLMTKKYNYSHVPQPGDFLITLNPQTREYKWSEYLGAFFECSELMLAAVSP